MGGIIKHAETNCLLPLRTSRNPGAPCGKANRQERKGNTRKEHKGSASTLANRLSHSPEKVRLSSEKWILGHGLGENGKSKCSTDMHGIPKPDERAKNLHSELTPYGRFRQIRGFRRPKRLPVDSGYLVFLMAHLQLRNFYGII